MECIKEMCYLRSKTDRISPLSLFQPPAPTAFLFNKLNIHYDVLYMFITMISFPKAQGKARSFIYTHKAFIFIIFIRYDLIKGEAMKAFYTSHNCTSVQTPCPETATPCCK